MREKIFENVSKIFEECLFRDLKSCPNPMDEHIFGDMIALLPAEAYYLLMTLEREFDIKFSDDVIFDYRFQVIRDIVCEIEKCIDEKKDSGC